MEKLIPASNFEVKKIKYILKINSRMSALIQGYAIWDKSQKGYVSMNDYVKGIPVPYVLKKKKYMQDAIGEGLYDGYDIVRI